MDHTENEIRHFDCPSCGNSQSFPFKTMVDVKGEPGVIEQIANGEFNVFTCNLCGTTVQTPYYWFLIDTYHQAFALVLPEDAAGNPQFYIDWSDSYRQMELQIRHSMSLKLFFQFCFGTEQLIQYLIFKAGYVEFRRDLHTFYRSVQLPKPFRDRFPHWPKRRLERLFRLAMMLPMAMMPEQDVHARLRALGNHVHHDCKLNLPDSDVHLSELIRDMRKTGLLMDVAGPTILHRNPDWVVEEIPDDQ